MHKSMAPQPLATAGRAALGLSSIYRCSKARVHPRSASLSRVCVLLLSALINTVLKLPARLEEIDKQRIRSEQKRTAERRRGGMRCASRATVLVLEGRLTAK